MAGAGHDLGKVPRHKRKREHMGEELETLAASLRHAIHYLTGIVADIDAGTYTREDAATDLDAITGSESFGFVGDLDTYANGGE